LYEIILFVAFSGGIVFVSWPSLRNWRSHGFYRFFAFEVILGLILLNVGHWFTDPFAVHQIASWLLLSLSLFLAVHGFYLLAVAGKPKGHIEQTTTLVKVGAYKYIRHPLYSSLLLLAWGVFLKDSSLLGGVVALVASAGLVATARVEEAENLQRFGEDYAAYMKTTKMFLPFLFCGALQTQKRVHTIGCGSLSRDSSGSASRSEWPVFSPATNRTEAICEQALQRVEAHRLRQVFIKPNRQGTASVLLLAIARQRHQQQPLQPRLLP
jgi:protein-S-isoprenylcysteine O-methyltransferase Ste14